MYDCLELSRIHLYDKLESKTVLYQTLATVLAETPSLSNTFIAPTTGAQPFRVGAPEPN